MHFQRGFSSRNVDLIEALCQLLLLEGGSTGPAAGAYLVRFCGLIKVGTHTDPGRGPLQKDAILASLYIEQSRSAGSNGRRALSPVQRGAAKGEASFLKGCAARTLSKTRVRFGVLFAVLLGSTDPTHPHLPPLQASPGPACPSPRAEASAAAPLKLPGAGGGGLARASEASLSNFQYRS